MRIKTMNERELEVCFYTNYRKWEEKFKEWVSDKTDRQMTIMEPVFFSWDKDVEGVPETLEDPIATINDPTYDTSDGKVIE